MEDAERFRAHAERCRAHAMCTADSEERDRLLKMAAAWIRFAREAEHRSGGKPKESRAQSRAPRIDQRAEGKEPEPAWYRQRAETVRVMAEGVDDSSAKQALTG